MFPARLNTLQSWRLPSTVALPFFSMVKRSWKLKAEVNFVVIFLVVLLAFVFQRAF